MKTIAIIDDDIHIGNMLEEVLRREGYNCLRAYSGTEALYLLSKNKPDLILLDLMLPGLAGAAQAGMWLFYLPGQVLLVLSGFPKRRGNTT